MSRVRSFAKYWLPVLVWLVVPFYASSDTRSYQHSSRIIAPILRWLFPHLSEHAINLTVLVARKGAHLTEYAVLGLLIWRALRRPVRNDPRPWSWRVAGWAVLIVALYACTDEFHQRFVPSRDPSLHDVLIDTAGAFLGMVCLRAIGRWRKWW
jgi:VanZ family protein